MFSLSSLFFFFFFNDTATTEIYTLSLHDALPILFGFRVFALSRFRVLFGPFRDDQSAPSAAGSGDNSASARDRKSTRLNSSHLVISYAVFCLKKKKKKKVDADFQNNR